MNRPTGVTVIAVLQFIGGVLGIIGGIAALGVSPFLGIVSLILGVAAIALGVGMWQLKPWAWMGTLVVQGIGVLQNIWIMIDQGFGAGIISLVINVIIIAYLLRPEIKAAFGQ